MSAGEEMPEEATSYGLVMPFICCDDHDGSYSADAFVAGCRFATIDLTLRSLRVLGIGSYQHYVEPALVPQLDLLAMHEGWTMTSEAWEEHPDDWVLVNFEIEAREGNE